MTKRTSWIVTGCAIVLILIITICALTSCSGKDNSDEVPNTQPPTVTKEETKEDNFDKDIYVIDIEKDSNGNVLHKTVFNAVTKHTYIYTFTYNANAWGMNVSTSVVIVNEDGSLTVPSVENELPVNPVG